MASKKACSAKAADGFIRFDMESSEYTQRTLDAFEKVWSEGWRNIGVVLQSYLKRSAGDVARMNELGARVRLCKGAYDEPASVAFRDKKDVDANFVELMQMLSLQRQSGRLVINRKDGEAEIFFRDGAVGYASCSMNGSQPTPLSTETNFSLGKRSNTA